MVIGLDGEHVGTVVERSERALRVRFTDGEERWVQDAAILDDEDGLVTLICYAHGVSRWLVQ